MKFIFWKAHYKSYPKIQFLSILEKYFKSYGNINVIWPLFGMAFYEIWPCQVTQAKNMSFPYLKSYCPLNFKKSHENLWFCCTPNGSYKEDNLKEGKISMPPPPLPKWNRVKWKKEASLWRFKAKNINSASYTSAHDLHTLPRGHGSFSH